VAVIRRGTGPDQQTVAGPLREIARIAEQAKIKPPAIIVVGEVVGLRQELNWFETMPLFGRRIVVTRAREQASDFLADLSALGADCIEFPTIEIVPPETWAPLDRSIEALETYQWVLFTSVNGVRYFFERLEAQGRDVRDLKGIRVGAIGPATAAAVQEGGIRPDLVPPEYRAESVVGALREEKVAGLKILLPRAARAREILPQELTRMGASVDVVPAYRTVKPDHDTERVRTMLSKGEIHMVTFTSSSTVLNFADMFGRDKDRLVDWMQNVTVACIGPITAETAKKTGFPVTLVPPEYTIRSLTQTIVRHFSS
jgi:uroporphyrinogen III methyltransferase/synthase